jgi:hypothetical protein
MEPPTLSLLPCGSRAFLRGGRSVDLLRRIRAAASGLGGRLVRAGSEIGSAPNMYHVLGGDDVLERIADAVPLELERDVAFRLAMVAPSIQAGSNSNTVDDLPQLPAGQVWDTFDFHLLRWVPGKDGASEGAALRYRSSVGLPLYFVEVRSGKFAAATSESEVIYRAASILGAPLCKYDASTKGLSAHWRLPAEVSRVLCFCSGLYPSRCNGQYYYTDVIPEVAELVLDALRGRSVIMPQITWFERGAAQP